MSTLKIIRKDHIVWAEINRRKAANAINFDVMAELELLLDEIEQNHEIKVLILSGTGTKYFISGGDLKKFEHLKTAKQGKQMAIRMAAILERIESGDFWSIACINGDTYGGGCEIMLALDFSISRKTAKFCFTQGTFSLPPGWGGLTRLVERVGRSRTLEWLGSSAIVPADVAYNSGLINRVSVTSDLIKNTRNWAEKLSLMDRNLISSLKSGSRLTLEANRNESFKNELKQFGSFWEHDDHHNKVQSFIKRKEIL